MGNLLKAALGAVGIAGGGIPTGYLIAGAVVAVLSILGGTWKAGYNYRGTLDEAAVLRVENDRLQEQADETKRQLDSVSGIQQADSDRARRLEERNKELEGNVQIQCDPPVSSVPVPPAVMRPPRPAKGIRSPGAQHTPGPLGRGTVRSGPGVAPGSVEPAGSEPPVEPRPGFAR